jgi:putative ABC transport system permease protein
MSQRTVRRARRRRLIADVGHDARYALRGMRRSPAFTAVAVLIMALGIGAACAVFSIINAVVLRPLDYPQPEELLQVWETNRRVDSHEDPVSPVDLRDWQAQSTTLEHLAGYSFQALALSGDGRPERLVAVETTPELFDVFSIEPALGRALAPGEDGPQARVAVLSDRLWRGRFGADAGIVGRAIILGGLPYVIVGVMPPTFAYPPAAELWVPYTFDVDELSRGQHFLSAVARLRDGVALRAARAEMDGIAARLEEEYPQYNANQGIDLVPLHDQVVGSSARALWVVFGAVAFVLVIACGNVGNMLLVRAAGRGEEISIRTALGAGRWRLVRQLLVEGVVLSLSAGVVGVLAAAWSLRTLVAMIPVSLPRAGEIGVDVSMLGFALLLAALTGIGFGLAPALQAGAGGRSAALAGSGGRASPGRRAKWLRDALIVTEVALTLVLLVTAGLLAANLNALHDVDPGFRSDRVLTARISLPAEQYAEPAQRVAFMSRMREQLAALAGVESYGTVDSLPFSGSRSSSSFEIEGDVEDADEPRTADRREVTEGYFATMGIPLLRGRSVDERDRSDAAPVVVVNEAFARRFFPDEEAIGRRVRIGTPAEVAVYGEPVWREIVGVVGNIIHDDLTDAPAPEMYMPYAQNPSTRIALALHTRGAPGDLADALRDAVLRVDPAQPIYDVLPMDARLGRFFAMAEANAWVLGLFSAVAMVLAVLGIYSVVAYAVAQRVHELGVRVALGARAPDVLRLVLRQGMTQIAIGLLLGLGGALLAGRTVRALLFHVDTTDPLLLALPAALLAAAGLLASLVPALRALRIDPVQALRR